MNEKLPKPILKALASQAPPTLHPSSDLLAAYAEHSLLEAERNSVVNHLAECHECREVVFLARGAAEEPAISKAGVAVSTRRSWAPRLVWIGTAAAGLLVGGYFASNRMASTARHETLVASNQETPSAQHGQGSPEAAPAAPSSEVVVLQQQPTKPTVSQPRVEQKSAAASPRTPTKPAQTADHARATVSDVAPVATGAAPEKQKELAEAASTTLEIVGAAPAALPRTNSFAPSAAGDESAALGEAVGRSMSLAKPINISAWRVDGKGNIEHFAEGTWTRALADQPALFRAVYARGDVVWAGGDGGALFHSSDGGVTWTKVALSTGAGPETGSIARVHFSGPQQGVVITSTGTIYATADGGATWAKR